MANTKVVLMFWAVEILAGILICVGFAMIYNTPKHLMKWSVVFGTCGLIVKFVSIYFGVTLEMATFFGALTIGTLAEIYHIKYDESRRPLTIPPTLQMIPGELAFKTIMAWGAFWQNPEGFNFLSSAIHLQIKTALVLTLLVLGIAMPNILFKNILPKKAVWHKN